MQRVLVLGSGFTAGPLIELITREGTIAVTVASNVEEQARHLASLYRNTTACSVDVQSASSLKEIISGHDLVVSSVPLTFHPSIARVCLAQKVNMVTTSYVSPEMQSLHKEASEAGITIMNEVGLDPGIDHMLAVQCFDEVREKGGKVTSFESWCGGLPSPGCANNPLKYKFSWSPFGVLLTCLNSAKYLLDSEEIEVLEGGALMKAVRPLSDIFPKLPVKLEGYPNRDSICYRDVYGLPHVKNLMRGTLRYQGYCGLMESLQALGLFSQSQLQRLSPEASPMKWRDLMAVLISQTDIRCADIRSSVLAALGGDQAKLEAIEKLHLLSDKPVDLKGTPINALCSHLERELAYAPGETDAVYLQHNVGIEWANSLKENRKINFVKYGKPNGHSAMAACVGKPAAIAARMLLSGQLNKKGVVIPTDKEVYGPILEQLAVEGLSPEIITQKIID